MKNNAQRNFRLLELLLFYDFMFSERWLVTLRVLLESETVLGSHDRLMHRDQPL